MSKNSNLDPDLLNRPEDWVKIHPMFWISSDPDEFLDPITPKLPKDWTEAGSGVVGIWTAGFLVQGLRPDTFGENGTKLDLLGVRLFLGFGDFSYVDSSQLKPEASLKGEVNFIGEPRQGIVENAVHALMLLPMYEEPEGKDIDAEKYSTKVELILGLLRGFLGRNIAARRVFENAYRLKDGNTFLFPGVVENLNWHGPPDIANQALTRLRNAAQLVDSMPEAEKNRVELSLRWFSQSFDEGEVDDFLKLWIAVETLIMGKDGKVRPVVEALAAAYSVTYQEAVNRFQVGLVQKVRHRIVHSGELNSVSTAILLYLQAIYLDVLEYKLGLPCAKRADKTINGKASGVIKHLQSLNNPGTRRGNSR